jgi:hypothetical protein
MAGRILPPRDLIDSYFRVVARQLPNLTRREVEEQLDLIVNDRAPTTRAGELIMRLYSLVNAPIPAG